MDEELRLAVMASKINQNFKITEAGLKEQLNNTFGEEGTGYIIDGNATEGWTITIPEKKISYFVNPEGEVANTEYEEPIDNSGSLVEGFVDDLGTRAMIYLYANPDPNINTAGDIVTIKDKNGNTLTNADGASQTTVKAVAKNMEGKLEITGKSYANAKTYYLAYPVTQNGTYTFKATKGTTETETKIKVSNIETFTAINDSTLISKTEAVTRNNTTIAYKYKETNEKFAYVPAGYYVDTNSNIDTGLVITDSVDANGYSKGNEWVWVPVETAANSEEEDRKFYVVASGNLKGADIVTEQSPAVTYSKYGKLYSFTGNTRETYGTFNPYGTGAANLVTPAETSGYREPSLLTDSTYGDEANITSIAKRDETGNFAAGEIKSVASQYLTDYNNMVTSVETYGGFYIGRYELAKVSQGSLYVAKVQPGETYTNETWFSLYNKCLNLNKAGTSTETSMIYGSLWDATMQWLSSSYDVGYTGNDYSGYGNYKREAVTVSNSDNSTTIVVKKKFSSQKLKTGQTSYTKSNNIYDLSGNCCDCTQEAAGGTDKRVFRGGHYDSDNTAFTYSASRANPYPSSNYDYSSSRPQLYIK